MNTETDVRVVIPARYASTRLPGKPLAPLDGLPMLVRTARQAEKAGFPILVAYDDPRIGAVLADFAIPALKTRDDHDNGTHRLSEVAQSCRWTEETLVVNVQGDEPLLPPALIEQVATTLIRHPQAEVATLATSFAENDPRSPDMVKVTRDLAGYALYFSRGLLPWVAEKKEAEKAFPYLRHIGIYAYRVRALLDYPQLAPSPLEQAEKLEQLRFLEHGRRIAVATVAEAPPAGVDSHADLQRIAAILRSGHER